MEREIGTKGTAVLEFADDAKGEVRAVVYTMGVVDNDREVILPPGFQGEAKVNLSHYGHSAILAHLKGSGTPVEPPVGKGVVFVNQKNEVEFRGHYFMSTDRGKQAYLTAKEMGPEQPWSFTFWRDRGEKPDAEWSAKGARRIWRNGIEPFEVSPVTLPGGVGTRTMLVKEADEERAAAEAEADAAAEAAHKAEEEAAEAARLDAEQKAAEALAAEQTAEKVVTLAAQERLAAAKLKAEIDAEVERFQRTRRQFYL